MTDTGVVLATGAFGRIVGGWAQRNVNAHAHSEIQVSINLGNAAVDYRLEERVETLHPGHALLMPSWKIHARNVQRSSPTFILVLSISPTWLAESRPAACALHNFSGCVALPADMMALLTGLCDSFGKPEFEVTTSPHPPVIALIDRLGQIGGGELSSQSPAPHRSKDKRIDRAVQAARGHLGKFNVDDIASEVGLSRTQFYRRFKDCFGVSPRLFLNAARMDWAVTRLIAGDEPIAEISDSLGFSSPGHFTRFFVMHTGQTPVSYRRRGPADGRSGPQTLRRTNAPAMTSKPTAESSAVEGSGTGAA